MDVVKSIYKYNLDQFSAKDHSDVKLNRRREDDVLCEFIDTFEQHHLIFVTILINVDWN